MLAEVPQITEITEGYVLSKHSDYRTDDRDYVRGDVLYVWAWSSRVNPYDVEKHYCQLTSNEYLHEFWLNYDKNMTPQYSYTGSFNLSRLEKTGDWNVQIFLKTKSPKPIIFSPPNVVIRVSETSTIAGKVTDNQGNPIVGARVTILETEEYTNTLAEPAGHYEFVGLSPSRYTIKVEASGYRLAQTSVVAEPAGTYTQDFSLTPISNVLPPFIPTELWQVAIGSLTVFGATACVLLWRRRRRFRREIKETEYRTTLEDVRLEVMLQELDNLLQKGLLSRERYETMRGEMEDELTRIRSLKS